MDIQYPVILTSFFFLCFIFSLIINYIMLKFVQTLGIRGKEANEIRWNPNVKPALGGISFYVIFLFSFIITILIGSKTGDFNLKISGILIACTLAFIMGLADDAFNTQPLLKFLTQLICAFVLIFSGHTIHIFENQFFNSLLTIFWVVGMMNSVNMLDNMDGITTIVSICACLFMIALNVSMLNTNGYNSILNLGVLGGLCGFLVYNFHPSRMFMGDTGSQFLGVFLAVAGIDNCWNSEAHVHSSFGLLLNFLLIALVFLIPLTDTTTVIVNRLKSGRSPFVGGKDHTTHHLFFKGITEQRIAILYFGLSSIGTIFAYNLVFNYSDTLFIVSAIYAALVFLSLYLNTVLRRK